MGNNMAPNGPLHVETSQGVAVITINRPERRNAIDVATGALLDEAWAALARDAEVRVIVITGAGSAFCAGADIQRLDDLAASRGATRVLRAPDDPDPVFDALSDAPPELRSRYLAPMAMGKPVIAAVNGACAGIGLALAVGCDLRFASSCAFFTSTFARRGLTAEHGLAWSLPALVGQGAAADILLSARRVMAAEALRMGLVNDVLEPDALLQYVLAYARDMAANVSPRSTRVIKRQLRLARGQNGSDAIGSSYQEMVASFACEDFQEGVAAMREKREPAFSGR